MSQWNEVKMKRFGGGNQFQDSIASTVNTYLNNGNTIVPSNAKQIANRKTSKATKGIEKCIKKLSKRAEQDSIETAK